MIEAQDLVDEYKGYPLLYISGPFTKQDEKSLQLTTDLASFVSYECFKNGWSVISAHKNLLDFKVSGEMPYDRWMYALSAQIAKCDAVLLLPGWKESKGTLLEIEFCEKMNIPVFDFLKTGIPDSSDF